MNEPLKRETFFGACPHDCPDTCAMIYEAVDGKLVDVRGNKDHPMTRGGLCVKLKDFHDHHYNPDRLLYPLRRWSGLAGSHPQSPGTRAGRRLTNKVPGTALYEIYAAGRWPQVVGAVGPGTSLEYDKLWRIAQARTSRPVKLGTISAQWSSRTPPTISRLPSARTSSEDAPTWTAKRPGSTRQRRRGPTKYRSKADGRARMTPLRVSSARMWVCPSRSAAATGIGSESTASK